MKSIASLLSIAFLAPVWADFTSQDLAETITQLDSGDPERVAAAQATLSQDPEAAIPLLIEQFKLTAAAANPDNFDQLIATFKTFQLMGAKASGAIEFMADSSSLLGGEAWEQWKKDDRKSAAKAFNDHWEAMRYAIGATGQPGFEMLIAGAKEQRKTKGGVPYASVLNTIIPNGADSCNAIVALAFSEDRGDASIGKNRMRYAADGVGEALLRYMQDASPEVRSECVRLLGSTLPAGLTAFDAVLDDKDASLRRLALIGLADWSNVYLLDPKTSQYRGYENWHGHLYPTRERPFEALEALRAEPGRALIDRALGDRDDQVRCLAAFVAANLARPGAPISKPLKAAQEDPSPAVQFWAKEAVARSAEHDLRALDAFLALEGPWNGDGIEGYKDLLQQELESIAENPVGYAELSAAESVELAIIRVEALLQWAEGQDEMDLETRLAIESIRQREFRVIVAACKDDGFGVGKSFEALKRFLSAAMPEIEAYYMQEPRFSVGQVLYQNMVQVLEPIGAPAQPLLGQALLHWRPSARSVAESVLSKLDSQGEFALPILLQSWRTPFPMVYNSVADFADYDFKTSLPVTLGSKSLPHLEELLDDSFEIARYRAARSILAIDAASAESRARAEEVLAAILPEQSESKTK